MIKMTIEQLLQLGTRQVVYLKAGMHDGEMAFVLYRADGIPLVAVDDMETAVEMVAANDLYFVAIHWPGPDSAEPVLGRP